MTITHLACAVWFLTMVEAKVADLLKEQLDHQAVLAWPTAVAATVPIYGLVLVHVLPCMFFDCTTL